MIELECPIVSSIDEWILEDLDLSFRKSDDDLSFMDLLVKYRNKIKRLLLVRSFSVCHTELDMLRKNCTFLELQCNQPDVFVLAYAFTAIDEQDLLSGTKFIATLAKNISFDVCKEVVIFILDLFCFVYCRLKNLLPRDLNS